MPKTFTTILWAYQNYGKRQQKIELTKIDQVFESKVGQPQLYREKASSTGSAFKA